MNRKPGRAVGSSAAPSWRVDGWVQVADDGLMKNREDEITMKPSRRDLIRFGGVSLLAGGLLDLLAARAAGAGGRATAKSCIILFQVGGPYQCDTFDPKPNAPDEV